MKSCYGFLQAYIIYATSCTATDYLTTLIQHTHVFITRLADLLTAGAVMQQVFQSHDAHIPFILQVIPYLKRLFIMLILLLVFH